MRYRYPPAMFRRLRRIAGQVRGLERMMTQGKYCVEIIHQSLAAKEALSSLENLVLENHLRVHAAEQMRSGKQDKAVKEILDIYKLAKRK